MRTTQNIDRKLPDLLYLKSYSSESILCPATNLPFSSCLLTLKHMACSWTEDTTSCIGDHFFFLWWRTMEGNFECLSCNSQSMSMCAKHMLYRRKFRQNMIPLYSCQNSGHIIQLGHFQRLLAYYHVDLRCKKTSEHLYILIKFSVQQAWISSSGERFSATYLILQPPDHTQKTTTCFAP